MKQKISKINVNSDYISIQDFVNFTVPFSSSITALAICKKSCPIRFFLPPVTTSAKLTPSISTAAAYLGFISLYSPIDCTPQLPICGAPNLNNSSSSIIVFSAPVSITASTSSDLLLTEIIALFTISINTNYIDELINLDSSTLQDYDTKLLQLQVSYTDDGEGKTSYLFSNTTDNKYGLQSMQKPWIVLMNYQTSDQPLFITTSRKTLSSIPLKVTATEDEKITKLTFNQSFNTATNLTLAFGYLGTVNTRSDAG